MNAVAAVAVMSDLGSDALAWAPQRSPALFTNEAAFCAWIANAEPGASTVYYRGHLGHDRMPSARVLTEPERKHLNAVADRALQAAEDGLIHLVQRRHGEHDFAYMAIKARQRIPARLVPAAALARR